MNLLTKLDAVEIKADNRISESDRAFCQMRQEAYDEARKILVELRQQWKGTLRQQEEKYGKEHYVALEGFSTFTIQQKITNLPSLFISDLVGYFNNTYHVSVSSGDIKDVLIPKEPRVRGWEDNRSALSAYQAEMRSFSLRYETVLDQIFIQLGGRTFMERALDEIKENCHKAAWNIYRKTQDFEIKGDTIRFTSYACKFSDWLSSPEWELAEGMKDILRGIAHFETGVFGRYPRAFSELLGWSRVRYSQIDFDCKKVKRLKMFKNNRVDVKFAGKSLANQFAEEYLGQLL